MDFTFFAAAVGAYLLGAVPFAVLAARAFRLPDPRTYGSGNPGATNIARGGGKLPAALTFLADFGKGFLPVFLLADNPAASAAAGFAATAGHIFSVFLRFRGGKGAATVLGVFLAWHPPAFAFAGLVWLSVFFAFRISAAASVLAVSAAAAITAAVAGVEISVAAAAAGILVVFRHRRNIADILRGRENRFGDGGGGNGGRFAKRMLRAAVVLAGVLGAVAFVHDYPATRNQIDLIRSGEPEAAQRPWLAVFFFLNEAGNGLKFFLTGNEKHMRHYPSGSHLLARREARAKNGGWRAQMELARRYYSGDGAPKDEAAAALWLRRAHQNAPPKHQPQIAEFLRQMENTSAPPLSGEK